MGIKGIFTLALVCQFWCLILGVLRLLQSCRLLYSICTKLLLAEDCTIAFSQHYNYIQVKNLLYPKPLIWCFFEPFNVLIWCFGASDILALKHS